MSTGEMGTQMRPACYQDLLQAKPVFEVRDGRSTKVNVGMPGRHCPSNMTGESYLVGWRCTGSDIGGSQGHVFVRRFRDASEYRLQTESEPRLWVAQE